MRYASRFAFLALAMKVDLERAWMAFTRPDSCRQLGRDPDALSEVGKAALVRKYQRDL